MSVLTSFTSLSTVAASPAFARPHRCFPKVKPVNRASVLSTQKKIKLRTKEAGATLPTRKVRDGESRYLLCSVILRLITCSVLIMDKG